MCTCPKCGYRRMAESASKHESFGEVMAPGYAPVAQVPPMGDEPDPTWAEIEFKRLADRIAGRPAYLESP